MRIAFLLFVLGLTGFSAAAQPCSVQLGGTVTGRETALPVAAVTIRLNNGQMVTVADKNGRFNLQHICIGKYHVQVLAAGYDTLDHFFYLQRDTVVQLVLSRSSHALAGVTVTGAAPAKAAVATLAATELKGQALFETRGASLGESLKGISGVSSIQTGPTISKPVIHGLHSNRVLILNNGVRQEGQQWGSEHAPEIDPFIASEISVVKGAESIRYGSDAMSGVVSLQPKPLAPQQPLQGEATMVAASNGRMGVASAMLEGKADTAGYLSWRAQGTFKRAGNFRTPHYYLANTGISEDNYSMAAAYHKSHYGVNLYYSSFNSTIGIFAGSHVGNVKDLDSAIARSRPITPSYFTYKIDRSYQRVKHNLLKADGWYQFSNGGRVEATYSRQANQRDEYDIDLPYSSDPAVLAMPQLSFKITTHAVDIAYKQPGAGAFSGSIGINGSTQGNVFRGIRYLVPNFRNYTGGLYAMEKYSAHRLTLEAGLRYDYRWQRAYFLNSTTLQPYNDTRDYHNITGLTGIAWRFNEHFSVSGNIGTAWRAPSINELYVDGVHLAEVAYESGNDSLRSERSYNFSVFGKYQGKLFTASLELYDNIINHFIYSQPVNPPVTLVSGTYPHYVYTQANVTIKGADIDITVTPFQHWQLVSKTSLLRAWNRDMHNYLVYMPADRFDNTVKYTLAGNHHFVQPYIALQNITSLKQTRVPPISEVFDYAVPPAGYSLFNLHAGFATGSQPHAVHIDLAVDNLTNRAYRDYLNRFRYFNDELGINVVLRAAMSF